jgi:putative transcriptional regulator
VGRAYRRAPVNRARITADEMKAWRAKVAWSQMLAARWLKVSVRTLENWEQGIASPSNPGLLRLRMAAAERRKA